MELVVDLERVYVRKKAANKEFIELVKQTGTRLLDLHGVGPSGAARLLVEVGDVTRFPTKGHLVVSCPETRPHDPTSVRTVGGVTSTSSTSVGCNPWGMALIHRLVRRGFEQARDAARAHPDVARVPAVTEYIQFQLDGLHAHHSSEDEHLWPRLRERAVS